MPTPASELHHYTSPKRKRGTAESIEYSPAVSPSLNSIAANLGEYPFLTRSNEELHSDDGTGNGSPLSNGIAGQLQTLDLQEQMMWRPPSADAGHTKKRFAQMTEDHGFGPAQYQHSSEQMQDSVLVARGVKAQPTSAQSSFPDAADDTKPPSSSTFDFAAQELPSMILDRPRMHNRSPPLDGDPEDNSMTWHEWEITGHDPTDPSDDGYGINGIGFKPTPAIAWARSQRRKQQLAEYKNREAREARQKRSERRSVESGDPPSQERLGKAKKKASKVRFDDN